MTDVILEVVGSVATITLNRPESMNAMNDNLMGALLDKMGEVTAQKQIRVVILTGAGRGFCAGADLKGVAGEQQAAPTTTQEESGHELFNTTMRAIHNCPVPTIARVNGAAGGGGFGLALSCDLVVAARSAFFVATFGPRLGIVPDLGSTWNLPRIVGRARALGISMLGERITADQAENWGLIWKCVDDAELDTEVERLANALAATSPEAMTRIRSSIDSAFVNNFSSQLDLELEHQNVLIPRNMIEGAKAFVEKREPHFKGR